MVDAGGVDPVATQAIDVAPARDVLETRAAAPPLDRRVLVRLGDGLAVLQEAAVVVEPEVVERVGDDLAAPGLVELASVDDRKPAPALCDELVAAHGGLRRRAGCLATRARLGHAAS